MKDAPRRPRRRPGPARAALGLGLAVLLAHLLLMDRLAAGLAPEAAAPLARLDADFITALRLPPPAPEPAPVPAPPAAPPLPRPPATAASDPVLAGVPPSQGEAAPPEAPALAPVPAPPPEPDRSASAPSPARIPSAAPASAPAAIAASAPAPPAAPQAPPTGPALAHAPVLTPAPIPATSASAGAALPGGGAASAPAAGALAAGPPPGEAGPAPDLLDGFAWPLSTELRYALGGHVRGEVQGSAVVRWIRQGRDYQAHLDVVVGPDFAPLFQRRTTSAGRIGPGGLVPRLYEERSRLAFAPERRSLLRFAPGQLTLASGQTVAVPPDVQDSASQYIQLAFRLAREGGALQPGATLAQTLALPRRVDRWDYDVLGLETVATPLGPLPAWRLKPRRAGDPSVYAIEAWLAPQLRWLPVRLLITDGGDSRIELTLKELPRQARSPAAPAAGPAVPGASPGGGPGAWPAAPGAVPGPPPGDAAAPPPPPPRPSPSPGIGPSIQGITR